MVGKRSASELLFDILNYVTLTLLIIVTIYPCLYVVFASFSDPVLIYKGSKLLFWPRGFTTGTYELVFKYPALWTSYLNTIFYVVAGTAISMLLTIMGAYGLSRRYLPGRMIFTFIIVFTMYFAGGMIPSFLLVKDLKLLDTVWAMLLPGAVNTFNLIIMLTYFKGIPETLEEAAKIDGANEYLILFRIFIPLALPVIAVIALYYAVAKWNTYFQALIYINDRKLYPLQIVLREIIIQNDPAMLQGMGVYDDMDAHAENVKYATIVVATVPILSFYPFLQKYFVKGVMVGAIKG